MSKQCFFCKNYENPGCAVASTTDNDVCPSRKPMSQEEIQETVDSDLKHITEVAQRLGVIPVGVTVEEYFSAIRRADSKELPQGFC